MYFKIHLPKGKSELHPYLPVENAVAEQTEGGGGGGDLYRGGNFSRKCISTTPIGRLYIFGPRRQYPLLHH